MATYPKQAVPERADPTSVSNSSTDVGCYVQKIDNAAALGRGVTGAACVFHLGDPQNVDGVAQTEFLILQSPLRHIICKPCAAAIKAAHDAAAQ